VSTNPRRPDAGNARESDMRDETSGHHDLQAAVDELGPAWHDLHRTVRDVAEAAITEPILALAREAADIDRARDNAAGGRIGNAPEHDACANRRCGMAAELVNAVVQDVAVNLLPENALVLKKCLAGGGAKVF